MRSYETIAKYARNRTRGGTKKVQWTGHEYVTGKRKWRIYFNAQKKRKATGSRYAQVVA